MASPIWTEFSMNHIISDASILCLKALKINIGYINYSKNVCRLDVKINLQVSLPKLKRDPENIFPCPMSNEGWRFTSSLVCSSISLSMCRSDFWPQHVLSFSVHCCMNMLEFVRNKNKLNRRGNDLLMDILWKF